MPDSQRPTRLDKTFFSRGVGVGGVNWILDDITAVADGKFET